MLAINARLQKLTFGKKVFISLHLSKPSFLLHVRAEQVLDALRPRLKNAIYCGFIFRKDDSWRNKNVGIKIFLHIDTKSLFEHLSFCQDLSWFE